MQDRFNRNVRRLELYAQRIELLHLDDFLRYAHDWKKRFLYEFLSGVVRGIGFSIGFSVLGALLIYFLRKAALENMPIIGRFLADLVLIVENNLK